MSLDPQHRFDAAARESFYALAALRRDCRHFARGAAVAPEQLQRLLSAAHCGPSVGLMQPWRLLRITDASLRAQLVVEVERERTATAAALGEREAEFLRLKVDGVADCAELLALVMPPDDGTVFGRRTLPREMALCSVGAAMQNLWLAARAEHLGMGWVSIFEPARLVPLLQLPPGAQALGLLCIGPVDEFYAAPMLELEDWRRPRPLHEMIADNHWPQAEESSHAD